MHSDPIDKCRDSVRQIDPENIRKTCVYRLPKGIRLKDFVIEKNEKSDMSCVIALGNGAMKIIESIMNSGNNYWILKAHINHQKLDDIESGNKLYVMCDIEDKEHLTKENRRAISEFVQAHKKVYLLTTLGKEILRSEVLEEISQHLRRIGREVTVLAIKPFVFELAPGRIEIIDKTLEHLVHYVSKIIVFNNEDLIDVSEMSGFTIRECFNMMDRLIASVMDDEYKCGNEECKDSKIIDIFLGGIVNNGE
ncbi:MAG: hypothetical protein PHZ17_01715 [Sulfurovum sp.]|nr:hypothetical protein [Sulfurovum sp.]